MKNLLTLLFLSFSAAAFAQTYSNTPVSTAAQCKEAEPVVLQTANLVLSKPLDDAAARSADAFIWTWAQNTEHTLPIAGPITKLSGDKANKNLLWIFIACEAKYILEHPEKAKDEDAVLLGAYTMLADYIAKTENGVVVTKNVKKILDAKTNNKMEEYVKDKK